jgi:hypothetical protein
MLEFTNNLLTLAILDTTNKIFNKKSSEIVHARR